MAQFAFVEWLLWWLIETATFEFEWDAGNSDKNQKKRGISNEEIEDAFQSTWKVPLGVQFDPPVDEERLGILAVNSKAEILMIAFTLRNGKVRPISARPASRKERRIYEAFRKTIERV